MLAQPVIHSAEPNAVSMLRNLLLKLVTAAPERVVYGLCSLIMDEHIIPTCIVFVKRHDGPQNCDVEQDPRAKSACHSRQNLLYYTGKGRAF